MVNKNFQSTNGNNENKSKASTFWKNVGLIALAIGLAVITVFVLNLNFNA